MASRWSGRRARLRGILGGGQCVLPASVHDAISARIAADLGFEMGMLAGSVAALTVLGAPDMILITLSELAEQAHRVSRGADLPLLVDADHGYGNALNVMRTVEELEAAGVAGLSIEDTVLPHPFGSGGRPALIPVEEGVGKIKAARAARADADLVIAGRTSAVAISGLDDAIARAKAYEAAGADAMFFVGVRTQAELDALCAAVRIPVILGGVPKALLDTAMLAERGVRVCLTGHQPFQAAIAAVHATLKALRAGTPPDALTGLATAELASSATRADAYAAAVRAYLERG
ncbi:MAG: isocitrate lyase/phosphoenolpyruvate mutase family protein [Hyphomicrobiaceae bacterium]|nr:isocitrate lyase/phosphoenolpyruvate mutase family protein [Hyphomicrobiaceae bacterium]